MVSHRVILTGGGTGGHIYPALAVAEQLREDPSVEAILYIGAKGHLEERLALERNLKFVGLDVSGMPRRLSLRIFSWPIQMASAILECRNYMARFDPTVVLGTGGYASAPALLTAGLMNIPYAVHEPDAHPGLVNRLLSRGATLVSCGMEGACDTLKPLHGRVVVNGNPVGSSFLQPRMRSAACAVLGLDPDLKTILVTGGSQGAQAINEAVLGALPDLLSIEPKLQVIHQVGEKNFYDFKEKLDPTLLNSGRYFLRGYFDDLALAYSIADLTVCRAGAMTVSELAVMGAPAIFVPFPHAAADHQTHNALFMAKKGAALCIDQTELSGKTLLNSIKELLQDEGRLAEMRRLMTIEGKPQAALDLTAQIKEVSTARQIREQRSNLG